MQITSPPRRSRNRVVVAVTALLILATPSAEVGPTAWAQDNEPEPAGDTLTLRTWFVTGLTDTEFRRWDVVLINQGEGPATAAVEAYDSLGHPVGRVRAPARLHGGEQWVLRAEVAPPGTTTLRIVAPSNISAVLSIDGHAGPASEAVPALDWDPGRRPHVLDLPRLGGPSTHDGWLVLLNPNHTPAPVRLLGLRPDGSEVLLDDLPPLAPMESRTLPVDSLFTRTAGQPAEIANIRAHSPVGLLGWRFTVVGGADVLALPGLGLPLRWWRLPLAPGSDIAPSVGLSNPGPDAARVELEARADNDDLVALLESVDVPARGSVIVPLDRYPESLRATSLVVRSDAPIATYLLLADSSTNAVAGVAASPSGNAAPLMLTRNDAGALAAWSVSGPGGRRSAPPTALVDRLGASQLSEPPPIPLTDPGVESRPTSANDGDDVGALSMAWTSTISPRFPLDGLTDGWLHVSGSPAHAVQAGYQGADDTYALDLNLPNQADAGRSVFAVEDGVVRIASSCYGYVLIEHVDRGTLTWQGRTYTSYYSGYMHMADLTVREDDVVTRGQGLGVISGWGDRNDGRGCRADAFSAHLHFALYVGRIDPASTRRSVFLESVDPAVAGYGGLGYGTNIVNENIDDFYNYKDHSFLKGGVASDWRESARGFYEHMWYTASATAQENWGRWSLTRGVPVAGNYRLYVFVPREFATTRQARYQIYRNGALAHTATANQQAVSDRWVDLGVSLSLAADDKIRVDLGDGTGETNAQVAFDTVKLYRKNDVTLHHEANCQQAAVAGKWRAEYYENRHLAGTPSMVRYENDINHNWGRGGPGGGCGIGTNNFSVRWSRNVHFSAAGIYRFSVTADDGFRLRIDGTERLAFWQDQAPTTRTVDVQLAAGYHHVVLDYYENLGGAAAQLTWAQTGGVNELRNGDFELGELHYWSRYVLDPNAKGIVGIEDTANHTPNGRWNAFIQPEGAYVEMYQWVGVYPGRSYRLEAWVATSGMTATLGWWSDANGGITGTCASTGSLWPNYVPLSCNLVVPPGTTRFNVHLWGHANRGLWAVTDDWKLSAQ